MLRVLTKVYIYLHVWPEIMVAQCEVCGYPSSVSMYQVFVYFCDEFLSCAGWGEHLVDSPYWGQWAIGSGLLWAFHEQFVAIDDEVLVHTFVFCRHIVVHCMPWLFLCTSGPSFVPPSIC